jgi:acid phosphatase family membrane protein YuiD
MYEIYPLLAAVSSGIIAQAIKPFIKYAKNKEFDAFEALASGGFPSSHTATTVALCFAFLLKDGFSSNAFMVSFILMIIVSYDAMNVRLYAGRHIALTDQLISDLKELLSLRLDDPIYLQKMKKILGHERFEVFGGFILGILISTLLFFMLGGHL